MLWWYLLQHVSIKLTTQHTVKGHRCVSLTDRRDWTLMSACCLWCETFKYLLREDGTCDRTEQLYCLDMPHVMESWVCPPTLKNISTINNKNYSTKKPYEINEKCCNLHTTKSVDQISMFLFYIHRWSYNLKSFGWILRNHNLLIQDLMLLATHTGSSGCASHAHALHSCSSFQSATSTHLSLMEENSGGAWKPHPDTPSALGHDHTYGEGDGHH